MVLQRVKMRYYLKSLYFWNFHPNNFQFNFSGFFSLLWLHVWWLLWPTSCDKMFSLLEDCKKHRKEEHPNKTCEECEMKFSGKLEHHISMIHEEDIPCPHCGVMYNTKYSLASHLGSAPIVLLPHCHIKHIQPEASRFQDAPGSQPCGATLSSMW